MYRKITLIFLSFYLICIASPGRVVEENEEKTAQLSWLKCEEKWIVDESGRRVALRGIAGDHRGSLDKWRQRLDWMKPRGLTAVRLAFPIPGVDLQQIDKLLDLFEEYGFYVILDCHNSATMFANKDRWINTWVEIAKRYKDRSVVGIYELCNEGHQWGTDNQITRDCFIECVKAIQKVDKRHICMVYENARSEYAIRLANEKPESGIHIVTWRKDNPPPENCAFKLGFHWLELRYWAIDNKYEHSRDHPAFKYYKDKFDLAYCWAAEAVNTCVYMRELYNKPALNFEYGFYDNYETHANYIGVKDMIRLCEEQCVGWNYWSWEGLENPAEMSCGRPSPRKSWIFDDVSAYLDKLIPVFKTRYFSKPEEFKPKPFDLRRKMVNSSLPSWPTPKGRQELYVYGCGPGGLYLANSNCWAALKGPCEVRIRGFAGVPDLRRLTNFKEDYIKNIPEGETVTIKGDENSDTHPGDWDWIITPYRK